MYYYIFKHHEAPSGIALIASFPKYEEVDVNWTPPMKRFRPINPKVLHDEVAHLGGTVDDVIGKDATFGEREIVDAKTVIKKVFD